MQTITVNGRRFSLSISEEEILQRVKCIAAKINEDYEGQVPLFLVVLNGAFVFAADLLREVNLPCEVSFVKMASYDGEKSTGRVLELVGLDVDVEGKPVIVVEDIVDTGLTMEHMMKLLEQRNPKSVDVCTLLLKPGKLQAKLEIRYCCMEIPNDFIVGYGLDYDGFGRNTRDIYTVLP